MTSPFWINDPNVLLKKDKITEIWPVKKMSFNEKLNAITRLVIMLTLIGIFIGNKVQIGITGIITVFSIVLLYYLQGRKTKEGFSSAKLYELTKNNYTNPTVKNPIMNVLLTERKDNPNRKPAAPSFNENVEEQINADTKKFIAKNFDDPNITEKLFQDLGDKFTFDRSMRQWYSTANTQIPNDQGSFAEWCYGDMISCKEGHELACTRSAPAQMGNQLNKYFI